MAEDDIVKEGEAEKPIRRRKSVKGQIRRAEILDAAMRHFADDGYQSASFAAIAEDVGLSLPGLLHYFPSKVDLLLAILDKRDIDSTPMLTKNGEKNWRYCLLGLVDVVKRNQTIAGVVRTFAILNAESLTRNHPAEAWFATRLNDVKATLVDNLTTGIKDGELKSDLDAERIAAELIAMMDGLQMLWLRRPDEFDMAAIFSAYVDRLIDTIVTR